MSQEPVYIVAARRTPIGSPFRGLKDFSAVQLAAFVIRNMIFEDRRLRKAGAVVLGNCVGAGTGQNIGRQAAILAGLPAETRAFKVDSVCGSGLQAVISAAQAVKSGDEDLVLAGGTESATFAPYLDFTPVMGKKGSKECAQSLVYDGLWCHLTESHMGELIEQTARQFRITRADQDRFAFESHQKALQAQALRKFEDELVPVKAIQGTIAKDERVRSNVRFESFAVLPGAFKKEGTITAGNSSVPSDGAALVALTAGAWIKKNKIKPLAQVMSYKTVFLKPADTFLSAAEAIKQAVKKAGMTLGEVDLFEIGESFAAQAILTQRQLNLDPRKVNIRGGDVAIGHPLGAAGARILVTLTHALRQEKKRCGVACICFGGGGAVAIVLKRPV